MCQWLEKQYRRLLIGPKGLCPKRRYFNLQAVQFLNYCSGLKNSISFTSLTYLWVALNCDQGEQKAEINQPLIILFKSACCLSIFRSQFKKAFTEKCLRFFFFFLTGTTNNYPLVVFAKYKEVFWFFFFPNCDLIDLMIAIVL